MNFKKYLCIAAALTALAMPAGAAERLTTGQGLPENAVDVTAEAQLSQSGPTLIFSDSPEMVYHKGVLYRDTVEGDVRIFFHHVNAMQGNKKLAILLKNNGLRPAEYTVTRRGVGDSSWHYLKDGKDSQKKYFSGGQTVEKGRLGFSRTAELLTGRGFLLAPEKLLTGTIDLHLDRPLEISVLMCEPMNDLELFNNDAPVQPMDEHPLRGTFKNADWQYKLRPLNVGDGDTYMLELASTGQGFIRGVDATTGKAATDHGNYGVMYAVDFELNGERSVRFSMNPLGGLFAGYGVLEHDGRQQLLALPESKIAFGDSYDDMLELGVLEAGKYRFIWSPPGASNLPIRLYWQGAKK